jgi:asparagine synthase (glutamine-hydrolysing)
MCGIAGHISFSTGETAAPATQEHQLQKMVTALVHRGPDASGTWSDPGAGVYLGHRRLSIVDLTDAGAQPMTSARGRYVVAYNGEIYDYRSLAGDLAAHGHTFTGHSDTEVLLAAIEQWGIETALKRINGMFAFALWDKQERTLTFARDRAGKKPLYLARTATGLAFASELRGILTRDDITRAIDPDSVAHYLRFMALPAPRSILRDAWQLASASTITITPAKPPEDMAAAIAAAPRYWDAAAVARAGQASARPLSDANAIAEVTNLLSTATAERMVADVPVGAFLSGGIDSSCVVAMMCDHATRPVETYTIGFSEAGYNEAEHAAAVAKALGTDHHELYLSGSDIRDVIPRLPDIYSEPFADSSQIPTYLISRFARSRVTVALSGDGGDEVFGGYNRHIYAQRLAGTLRRWPLPVRRAVSAMARMLPPHLWDKLLAPLGQPQAGDRLFKLAGALDTKDTEALYLFFQSVWQDPAQIVRGIGSAVPASAPINGLPTLAGDMMLGDYLHYLPTDPLHKVDRASMAVSLEVRSPLLDTRLYELAWSLPERMKLRDGKGKWLLQQLLTRRLPHGLMDRPKQGFGVPIGPWLRGPLREWAEHLLDPARLEQGGLLDPAPVRAAWQLHLSGRENLANQLWAILMLEAWREHWGI